MWAGSHTYLFLPLRFPEVHGILWIFSSLLIDLTFCFVYFYFYVFSGIYLTFFSII